MILRRGSVLLVTVGMLSCAQHRGTPMRHAGKSVAEPTSQSTVAQRVAPGANPPSNAATPQDQVAVDAPPAPRHGPCPKPTEAATRLFGNAWKLAEGSAAEPHHALAEALRIRLDALHESGCRGKLDDRQLEAELRRLAPDAKDPPELFAKTLNASTMVGHHLMSGSGVAMYSWRRGKVRTRIDVTNEGTQQEERLLLLDADLFQPPGAAESLLVVANTHPWQSSCWRSLRIRVLAAGTDPRAHVALLDHKFSGRWCEGIRIRTDGADVHFTYNGWARLFLDSMVRAYSLSFRYHDGVLERRFGFVTEPRDVVEDWLTEPWELASQATLESAKAPLQSMHGQLAAAVALTTTIRTTKPDSADQPDFTSELFPVDATSKRVVVYCALAGSGKPCPTWPKPVDFTLRASGDSWRLANVQRR